jgi:hypothetical protein
MGWVISNITSMPWPLGSVQLLHTYPDSISNCRHAGHKTTSKCGIANPWPIKNTAFKKHAFCGGRRGQ